MSFYVRRTHQIAACVALEGEAARSLQPSRPKSSPPVYQHPSAALQSAHGRASRASAPNGTTAPTSPAMRPERSPVPSSPGAHAGPAPAAALSLISPGYTLWGPSENRDSTWPLSQASLPYLLALFELYGMRIPAAGVTNRQSLTGEMRSLEMESALKAEELQVLHDPSLKPHEHGVNLPTMLTYTKAQIKKIKHDKAHLCEMLESRRQAAVRGPAVPTLAGTSLLANADRLYRQGLAHQQNLRPTIIGICIELQLLAGIYVYPFTIAEAESIASGESGLPYTVHTRLAQQPVARQQLVADLRSIGNRCPNSFTTLEWRLEVAKRVGDTRLADKLRIRCGSHPHAPAA